MTNMYTYYLLEKEGKETLEFPEKGFVTYRMTGDICHICVLYVKPLERHGQVARELMKALIDKMGKRAKAITACCYTKQENTTNTLKILLYYGFDVVGVQDHDILLYKDLKNA